MGQTTTELTQKYIKEHPEIRNCLKKGLINYSSLARRIAKELGIEKNSSKEAILIAARRFRESLKKEETHDKKIRQLLSKSEMEIRNKISVFILEKTINSDLLDELQRDIRKSSGIVYLLEGSDNYTVITQDRYADALERRFRYKIIKKNMDLSLINLKSPKDIESTAGVVSYLTSLFGENGVNILEFLSCWTDTLFVIDSKDLNRTIDFLRF